MAKPSNAAAKKIFTEIGRLAGAYETVGVDILDRLPFYQYKTIRMCEFYSNSKYLRNRTTDGGNFNGSVDGGNLDDLGREKPFYNIVNFRVTLAKTATDLDVKDVRIEGNEPKDWVKAMLLQHEAYQWMTDKDVNFSYFLNKAGLTRAKYGGVLVKKTETVGDKDTKAQLMLQVVDWRLVITDQIDILGGTIIENHWMTPVELSKKSGVWNAEQIKEAIKKAGELKNRKVRGYDKFQYNSERINVQEIHGEFPVSFLKDAQGDENIEVDDDWTFTRQRYFLADVGNEKFVFLAEDFDEQIYDYLPWEEMPGRALGRGVIEDSEEAQVWTNDSVINEKNAMDLAGKVVLTSDDPNIGNNIFTVDNGKIFELKEGKSLNVIKLDPAALGEFENQINRWQSQADYATSSYDANTGEQPPAGTPYAQTQLLNQIAEKPFDYRRQEMGIFISGMFDRWVIPYLITQIKAGHILTSDYSDDELQIIDNSFAIHNANQDVINTVIKTGTIPSPEQYQGIIQSQKSQLYGNKRAIEFPDGYFDDIECETTVIVTNEQKDKNAMLQSLSTIMLQVANSYNPQTGEYMILKNPILAKIFGSIVEMSGVDISPTSLGIDAYAKAPMANSNPVPQQQQIPQQTQANPVPAQATVVQ